jgi:hypothetical protein
MTAHQIWFITGSSRGFGWALASAVGETSQNRMRGKAITSFRPLMNSDRFLHRESDS